MAKLWLFQVSENPNFSEFVLLPVPNADAGVRGEAIWAVDERRLVNCLLSGAA